ncbi:hypothetical protein I3760_15G156100 [Carya illinoinensis]|nr:hypothetical protein I3760_15G156100 [Carya illinoinensis]
MQNNLDWLNIVAFDYPTIQENFTAAHAPLYDPGSQTNTDFGMRSWIGSGVSADKLVLGLPFYGYVWKLKNSQDTAIGAPATGPVVMEQGEHRMSYKDIKDYIQRYGAASIYNATYVVNYCTNGSTWIGFDDIEAVNQKVSYAKDKGLLGYYVWRTSKDDNWMLSSTAGKIGLPTEPPTGTFSFPSK